MKLIKRIKQTTKIILNKKKIGKFGQISMELFDRLPHSKKQNCPD